MELTRVVQDFEKRWERLEQKEMVPESLKIFSRIKLTYYQGLLNAAQGQSPVVWNAGTLPTEIISAAGAAPFMPEVYATQVVLMGPENLEYFESGYAAGLTDRLCKGYLAAAGMSLENRLPHPAGIISSNLPCDSSNVLYRLLSQQHDCPAFSIFIPLAPSDTFDAVRHYAGQLEESASFLSRVTGRAFDRDRFSELVDRSRQTYNLMISLHQKVRRKNPCPIPSRIAGALPSAFFIGRDQTAGMDYYRALSREMADREQTVSASEGRERRRIGWLGVYPYCSPNLLNLLRDAYQADIVMDFGNFLPEPEQPGTGNPFIDLALRDLNSPGWRICRPYAAWRDDFLAQVKVFQMDAFILYHHQACSNINSLGGLVRTDLEKMGIPVLILDGEPVDPQVVSEDRQAERLDIFFSTFFD